MGRSQHLSIIFSRFERPIFQVQSAAGGPKKYSGPVDVIRSLYKEGGIRSIFKGSAATAARGKAGHTLNNQHDSELVFHVPFLRRNHFHVYRSIQTP